MNSDPSIDILTQRLAEAEIDPQLRDTLATDLDWAARINGNPDTAMQGIKRLVVSGVRRELLACDRDRETRADIRGIVQTCAERHAESRAEPPAGTAGWTGMFTAAVKVLTPWRWPIAVAACSPWSAGFVQAVAEVFRKVN